MIESNDPPTRSSWSCPRCRAVLAPGIELHCASCQSTYATQGRIVNFIGESASVLPRHNDQVVAEWLVGQHARIAEALANLPRTSTNEFDSNAFVEFICAGSTIDREDVATLLRRCSLTQIAADITHYFDARSSDLTVGSSKTIEFLHANARLRNDQRALDVGCSAGRHLTQLSKYSSQLVGLDVNLFALSVGASAWEQSQSAPSPLWCAGDATRLPFQADSFDMVTSFVVFGLLSPYAALREIHRVLRPGGQVLVTVEGTGFWQKRWDQRAAGLRPTVDLARWWLARKAVALGIDLHGAALGRRFAGVIQYTPPTLRSIAARCGFTVDKIEILTEYSGQPALQGLVATKN